MKYHFKIHQEGRGYWAECLELVGCKTQSRSKRELVRNMREVLNLYLDEPHDSKVLFPLPKKRRLDKDIVAVQVDPNIAFSFQLRYLRQKRGLTQQQVAHRLGIQNLYGYQRLENSKSANPQLSTIFELQKIFPDLSVDEILR